MRNLKLGLCKNIQSPKLIIGFLVLTIICMIARIYKIPLSYGVYISFSSFFLFVILKLYGTAFALISSIIVNIYALALLNPDRISLFISLEILIVGMIYKYKTQNLFLSEMIYWLILGCPATSLYFLITGEDFLIVGIVAVFNQFILGLLNALLADLVVSYLNPIRLFRSNSSYTIDFSLLIFHCTLISVLIPFTIYVFIDGVNINKNINTSIIQTMQNKNYEIFEQLKSLNIVDLRKVKINSPIQINKIKKIIDSEPEGSVVGLTIQDESGKIYVSNRQANNYHNITNLRLKGKVIQYNANSYILQPELVNHYTDEMSWKNAFFIKETKFDDIDLKLVIQIPLSKYLEDIWRRYLDKFYTIIIACAFSTILSIIISRILSGTLLKLAESTTDIPNKLNHQEKINWPNTAISQIKSLVLNFTEMTNKLEQLFSKEKEMNNQLLLQTAELEKSKEKLRHLAYYDVLTDLPNRLILWNT